MLFCQPYAGRARDSKKTFNPDIKGVKVVVNGIPNKVYSQEMKTGDLREDVFSRFGKENSPINLADFYLEIDLLSLLICEVWDKITFMAPD